MVLQPVRVQCAATGSAAIPVMTSETFSDHRVGHREAGLAQDSI